MRCILVGPSAPIRGGIAIDNDARAHALRQAGHDVEQVSFSRLYPKLFFPGRSQSDDTAPPPQSPAYACLDSINPLSWWHTARLITTLQPSVVTFQWWHPFFAPCYATIMGYLQRYAPAVPRYIIAHNTRPHEPLLGQDLGLRLAVHRSSGVIVHSQSEYSLLASLVPGTTLYRLDYAPLETSRALPDRADAQRRLGVSGRVLLFFGYVRAYKGLDLLLHALAQVPKDLGVSLVVAGEFYIPQESYRDLIRSLGIEAQVRIIDRYIGEAEWGDLFAATDALVLPYRTASQSMSIILAYGFGKPVIATRVGGFAEIIDDGHTGLIAEPEPTALTAAIQRFYTSFLFSPYSTYITAKRRHFGWKPFIRLLEQCQH